MNLIKIIIVNILIAVIFFSTYLYGVYGSGLLSWFLDKGAIYYAFLWTITSAVCTIIIIMRK